eukprot:6184309-Pleurochrysis_carterae.AAC.2
MIHLKSPERGCQFWFFFICVPSQCANLAWLGNVLLSPSSICKSTLMQYTTEASQIAGVHCPTCTVHMQETSHLCPSILNQNRPTWSMRKHATRPF